MDRSREGNKSSLTHLAKTLNEMEVSPPNVVAPTTDSNPYLEMVLMQSMQQNNMSGARQLSPPQGQGRSITDLSYSSPHHRAYTNFDGFMPNGSYYATPPNTTCDFKGPIPSYSTHTFTSNARPNTNHYPPNSLQPSQDSFQNDFATAGVKPSANFHYSQYNMARAPNVTITAPDPNLQDLRNAVAANGRAETSPKYPFVSPLSPTLSWSNSHGQADVNMDTVDSLTLHGYNAGISPSDQQIYNISRQLMNIQQQQHHQQMQQQQQHQPQRQNGYQQSFYTNDQLQYRNTLQQGHNGLK